MRKPVERRLYELARKHCGRQQTWRISLDLLRKKCGSGSTLKEFKRLISKVIEDDLHTNHLPDYCIRFDEESTNPVDIILFTNRGSMPTIAESNSTITIPQLQPDTYHDARLAAPGRDVYELERQWRSWLDMSGSEPPRSADAAFLGFCKKWFTRRIGS